MVFEVCKLPLFVLHHVMDSLKVFFKFNFSFCYSGDSKLKTWKKTEEMVNRTT